ncbi:hypothetical protein LY78DRAFT_728550, partial [Colletotrichum sublineola]
ETYNTRYSLVVTDPNTNPAITGLSMGERTGSRVSLWVWSYVTEDGVENWYNNLVNERCCIGSGRVLPGKSSDGKKGTWMVRFTTMVAQSPCKYCLEGVAAGRCLGPRWMERDEAGKHDEFRLGR